MIKSIYRKFFYDLLMQMRLRGLVHKALLDDFSHANLSQTCLTQNKVCRKPSSLLSLLNDHANLSISKTSRKYARNGI